MADAIETLKGLLGDDAEDKIKDVMSSLTGSSEPDMSTEASDELYDLKSLMDKLSSSRSDPRANLLLSLKPYMNDSRRRSIDGAVRLLNIGKLSGLMRKL